MNIAQIIQDGAAKANELFARLAETGGGAIKTRERLLADLKAELELQARLEEEHLFPVLRKHAETKELVTEARNDNKQVRALLAELEQMPKEGEAFLERLGELRRIFQQHVRDDKKELLPAIRKALSAEATQEVTARIEAGRVEAEEAKRAEAEQRRAEARREREEAERQAAETQAREQSAEEAEAALARSAKAGAEAAQAGAETVRQAVAATVDLAAQAAERSLDQAARLTGLAGEDAAQATRRSARNLDALVACSAILAHGLQGISREWLSFAQDQMQRNLDGFDALLRVRTPQALVAAQSGLWRQSLEDLLSRSVRVSQLSARTASEAVQRIAGQAEESAQAPENAQAPGRRAA